MQALRGQHELGDLFDKQGDPVGLGHDMLQLRCRQLVASEPLDHLRHLPGRQTGHREQGHVGAAAPGGRNVGRHVSRVKRGAVGP